MAEKENKEKQIKVEDVNEQNATKQTSSTNPQEAEATDKQKDNKKEEKEESKDNAECDAKKALEEANKTIADLKDKYLRTLAEFDNYKKRTIKEKAELILNGSEKAVCAILPILDDFERALANKTDDAEVMKEGMKLIFNKFNKTVESLCVKKI